MFCPKCSQAQVSEKVRFCSRCGFRLDTIKELIEDEETTDKGQSRQGLLPQQKDISIGAGLMFIGGLVALLWGFVLGGPPVDSLPQAFLILGSVLSFILLLFHPLLSGLRRSFSGTEEQQSQLGQLTKQRDGINLGAVLMFLGTVKAMALATFEADAARRGPLALAIMTGMFLLLLVIRWLWQSVYRLFFKSASSSSTEPDDEDSRTTSDLEQRAPELALPPALSIPVENFAVPRVRTHEMAQASVTEQTTDLLENRVTSDE